MRGNGIAPYKTMMNHPSLLDLVMKWEELQASGQPVSPAELCRNHPELLDELNDHLASLVEVGCAGRR